MVHFVDAVDTSNALDILAQTGIFLLASLGLIPVAICTDEQTELLRMRPEPRLSLISSFNAPPPARRPYASPLFDYLIPARIKLCTICL